ncbi:dihydroxy-acid dehydratase ilv3 [Peltigera leucophlebia]|nr:dihydroxy-acid dehydratase ilv3 [Peltigera leucophlebia]
MASALEVKGMTLPGSSSNPAESQAKYSECVAAGEAIRKLLAEDIRPSDILTRQAFENAMILILRGSLAPGGSVGKITGKEGMRFSGKAKVYDPEDDMVHALEQGAFKKGEKAVVVIRYERSRGGPGMPEMLTPSSAIMGAGLGQDVALVTDGRFSGGSHGFLIGHVVPEAQDRGPIALIQDGDEVVIDADTRRLDLLVDEHELKDRRKKWVRPKEKYERGTLKKYASLDAWGSEAELFTSRLVTDASHGCITDAPSLLTSLPLPYPHPGIRFRGRDPDSVFWLEKNRVTQEERWHIFPHG